MTCAHQGHSVRPESGINYFSMKAHIASVRPHNFFFEIILGESPFRCILQCSSARTSFALFEYSHNSNIHHFPSEDDNLLSYVDDKFPILLHRICMCYDMQEVLIAVHGSPRSIAHPPRILQPHTPTAHVARCLAVKD